jgi:hypothetical protein
VTGIARIDRQVGVRVGFKVGLAVVAPGDVARDRAGRTGQVSVVPGVIEINSRPAFLLKILWCRPIEIIF